jgi:plastocyanin
MLRFARAALQASRLGLALGFAIFLAACGGSAATGGPATALPSGAVTVEAREFAFTPASITVPAGAVTFSITNAGTQDHEFQVLQGDQVVDAGQAITPGSSRAVTLTLAAGDYTFLCKLNGHDQLGMKGMLTVTS